MFRGRGVAHQLSRWSSSSSTSISSRALLARLRGHYVYHPPPTSYSNPISRSLSTSVDVKENLERKVKTPKMSVKQVLAGRPSSTFTVDQTCSVKHAINHLVTKKISSTLILDSTKEIVGIVTARDLLRYVNDLDVLHVSSGALRGASSTEGLLTHKITDVMTPVDRLLYCSPKDTVKHCREIMFQMKIRHMPVLAQDAQNSSMIVVGIVTMSDLSDAEFNNELHGGKKGYIYNVIGRKGLPRGTRVLDATPDAASVGTITTSNNQQYTGISSSQHSSIVQPTTVVRSGSYTLPHPFKTATGVAGNRRQYGAHDLCEDNALNEDAHFVMTVQLPNLLASSSSLPPSTDSGTMGVDMIDQVYACVADGVGSWRGIGVDPKMYSHRLVANTESVIRAETTRRLEDFMLYQASQRKSTQSGGSGGMGVDLSAGERGGDVLEQGDEMVHPLDAMFEAWHMTNEDQHIIGSCTICVATIDVSSNQLSYSNVGDGGLMVVRHVPRDGTLNAKVAPTTHMSASEASYDNANYKIAYLAQQQLRSFNFPFQLGNAGPDHDGVFERPTDADTASIPLMPNDIVVMASDGLFDNLEISEIISIISAWEQEGEVLSDSSDLEDKSSDSESEGSTNRSHDSRTQALAKSLVLAAREASLDKHKDSPFALLAKENDIMWGGGMPDDTTVVIMQLKSHTEGH